MAFAMNWMEFRIAGHALANPAVLLGVFPHGEFINAMEIAFKETPDAARRRAALARGGYSAYRVRQTLEEKDFQFAHGQWLDWSSQPAGTADDYDAGVTSFKPPDLRAYDTPGFSAWSNVTTPQTSSPGFNSNGVASRADATELWIQHKFQTWVDGQRCFDDIWEAVSMSVSWHNSLHLTRPSPGSPWVQGSDCEIQHGPMDFGTTPIRLRLP